MKRILAAALASAVAATLAAPAFAKLPEGQIAPEMSAVGMTGGKEFTFKLSDALKKGPVVIYFFPAAFTSGCTVETQEFAKAAEQFKAAGATLIGLTAGAVDPNDTGTPKKPLNAKDNLALLQKFSEQECRSAFPIASVTPDIMKAYDVILPARPDWTSRTSYVIGKDGKIALSYEDMKPNDHITKTLAAVQSLK